MSEPQPPQGHLLSMERGWRLVVIIAAAVILVVVTTRWTRWVGGAGWQSTDDAYLQADVTPIAAKVAGYVKEVPVQDYERVKAGQLIAQIVDDDYRATQAQAQANADAAAAQIQALEAQRTLQQANVQAAAAVVAATRANVDQNGRDIARQKRLVEAGSSSTEATEKVQNMRADLQAQLQQTRAQAEAARRQVEVLTAQIEQARAAVEERRAELDLARINLGYTRIIAPADGVLGPRQILPGQYVSVGGQFTTLTPLPHVWVTANYKETQLTHMALGQKAEITVDTFPGHILKGHVMAFSPASGAEFALLPPDNATGNFTKIVQRIAVKIAVDDADGLGDLLRPGMSVIARIDARAAVP